MNKYEYDFGSYHAMTIGSPQIVEANSIGDAIKILLKKYPKLFETTPRDSTYGGQPTNRFSINIYFE